ncbi:MAG: hypothetical protein U5Q03_13300 [Bacteroidota bacterium]|nr:hypothetical protein [Bacteroidota bacterium]
MKKAILILACFLSFFCISDMNAQAQGPGEPPSPPADHGTSSNQLPNGAPVGSGLVFLLALAGGYGVRKYIGLKGRRKK